MADKTYTIWTIGCQMNEADSRNLASHLELLGYREVEQPEQADVVVLNTCVVRQQAENKIYGRLGSLKKLKQQRPDMVIALMGCLVGVKDNPELRRRFGFVDVFVPPSAVNVLVNYLLTREDLTLDEQAPVYDLPETRRSEITAFVPAVLGCSHACAYCVIPSRRGREFSRPADDILREVRELTRQGIREVMLLGQIVDRYGLDLPEGPDLAGLLRQVVDEVPELYRVRFLTSHPNWITDSLLDTVVQVEPICPQLEIAVQAGNDEVLRRMKRGYTVEKFLRLVERVREKIPDAAIHTDVIVAFPGETEAQFEDTVKLLREVRFDKVHIAKYSERPGTYAAENMADDIAPAEKERRRKILEDLQKQIQTETNRTYLGRTVEVLVEGRNKGRWQGRTPQNKIVFFEGGENLTGSLVPVRLEWTGPFSLIGSRVEAADYN